MVDLLRRLTLLSLPAALALAVAGCERAAAPPAFNAIDITGAEYARDFDLPDADGHRRTLADFRGKVTLV
ncbi:MAG: SCO family protein, partial [Rhodoferax sp.]